MVRDGLVFKDEDGQVIFNQYSFCELVKHLLVELVGISYEEASQIVERSPLAEPVADALGVAIFSHDLPYYWAMFFYYGNGYWWGRRVFQRSQRIWMPMKPEHLAIVWIRGHLQTCKMSWDRCRLLSRNTPTFLRQRGNFYHRPRWMLFCRKSLFF